MVICRRHQYPGLDSQHSGTGGYQCGHIQSAQTSDHQHQYSQWTHILYTTMFTAASSLFIYNATGGFNLAHLLSVFTVLALLFAILCRIYYAGVWIYLEHLALTGTVFFSLIPTTAEVLTRTGVVTGLESPLLGLIYSYYVLIFAVLVLYQMYRIRRNPYNLSEFNRI